MSIKITQQVLSLRMRKKKKLKWIKNTPII